MNARTLVVGSSLDQRAVATRFEALPCDRDITVRVALCSTPFRIAPGQKQMVIGWLAASPVNPIEGEQWLDCRLSLFPAQPNPPAVAAKACGPSPRFGSTVSLLAEGDQTLDRPVLDLDSQDAIQALFELLEGKAPAVPQAHSLPLAIRTMGCFDILRNNAPLDFEGKVQRKPMALLKALIALGGSDVPIAKLISIVWADAPDGDRQTCFDVTLHRLRKLLGHQTAIQVADRRVSLNRQTVWVDLWELERELGTVVPLGQACVPTTEAMERAAPAILDLYRGRFLPGEADTSWLLPVRNRLSGRFHRFVMRLGDHWEAAAEWPRAAELFERAIELEPLSEAFYCRLMVCLREQGYRNEAIDVFRRLRQMLSVTLGVKPAQTTEAVLRELLDS